MVEANRATNSHRAGQPSVARVVCTAGCSSESAAASTAACAAAQAVAHCVYLAVLDLCLGMQKCLWFQQKTCQTCPKAACQAAVVPAARWDNTGTHYSKRRKVKNTLSHRTQVDENTWTWQRLGALRIPPQQGPYSSECKGRHAQLDCGTWCQPRLGAEAHTDKPLPWPYRTPPLKLATCTLHSEAIVCLSWTTTRPVRSALRSLICRCRVALWVWLRNQIKRSEGPDTCLVSGLLTDRELLHLVPDLVLWSLRSSAASAAEVRPVWCTLHFLAWVLRLAKYSVFKAVGICMSLTVLCLFKYLEHQETKRGLPHTCHAYGIRKTCSSVSWHKYYLLQKGSILLVLTCFIGVMGMILLQWQS